MRRDLDRATNGSASAFPKRNGFAHANGGSAAHTNGSAHDGGGGGGGGGPPPSPFFGHDREEVARLLIQALEDLDYPDAARALVRESGHELESPTVAAFRAAVLRGEWADAETYLFGPAEPPPPPPTATNAEREREEGGVRIPNGHAAAPGPGVPDALPLVEGVDRNELRFQLRRQKYLELLEQRDQTGALAVLRQELTPMHRDTGQLHSLSRWVAA